MNILYDNIIFSLQHCGGISVVWGKLLDYATKQQDVNIHIIEYKGAKTNLVRKDLDLSSCTSSILKRSLMKLRRLFNPSVPDRFNTSERFIFHSSYYRTCSHPNAINITTVHDFGYYLFVKNPLLRKIHCHQQFNAIRKSDWVACISQNTRKDLLRIMPDVNPDKVVVINNGVDKRFNVIEGAKKQSYVLFVGKRDRYKNFDALISPLSKCGRTLKIVGVPLNEAEKQKMNACGLKYEYCGFVSDEELNRIYNSAFCLLYTSLYEGFGLPVLEAQMAGCPVIAMNASSIPEVIGDKRLLLNEMTEEALKNKFELLANNEERDKIVAAGLENAISFSWEKMSAEYFELYRNALKQ